MKNQASFSMKDKKCLLQFLLGALRANIIFGHRLTHGMEWTGSGTHLHSYRKGITGSGSGLANGRLSRPFQSSSSI